MKDLIESILNITDDPRRDYSSDDDVEQKLFELLTKQLHKLVVSGKWPDYIQLVDLDDREIREIAERKEPLKPEHGAFIRGMKEMRAIAVTNLKAACASGEVDKTVCDGCEDITGFYLGTTCPKCNRPFRQVIR